MGIYSNNSLDGYGRWADDDKAVSLEWESRPWYQKAWDAVSYFVRCTLVCLVRGHRKATPYGYCPRCWDTIDKY